MECPQLESCVSYYEIVNQHVSDQKLKNPNQVYDEDHYGYRQNLIIKRRTLCWIYFFQVCFSLILNFGVSHVELIHYDNSTDISSIFSASYGNQTYFNYTIFVGKWLLTINSIALMAMCYSFHNTEARIYKFDNNLPINTAVFIMAGKKILFMKRKQFWIYFELIMLACHPFWVSGNAFNFVESDFLIFVYFVQLIRIPYAFVRLLLVSNDLFFSIRKIMIACLNRFSIGILSTENCRYIIRSQMEEHAFRIMGGLVLFFWGLCSYQIFLYEWRYILIREISCNELPGCIGNLPDAIWTVWISFTAIGYGEFYPSANVSRVMIFLQSVLSIITTSVFFGVITMKLSMSKREKLVQYNLMMEELEYDLRHKAATVLQSLWRARNRLRAEANHSRKNSSAVCKDQEQTIITESEINMEMHPIRMTLNLPGGQISTPIIQGENRASTDLCHSRRKVSISEPTQNKRTSTLSTSSNHLQTSKSFSRRLSIARDFLPSITKSFLRRESAIPEENNSQIRIKIEESQVVHQSEVIKAVNNFAQVRNQHIFRRSREDVEGTHRSFEKLEEIVAELSSGSSELSDRVDILSDRIGNIEINMGRILRMLEQMQKR